MKIEFRKVSPTKKEFATELDSVKFEGTFCKITPKLIELDAQLSGNTTIECCKCGENIQLVLDEELHFLISDGIYSNHDEEKTVIEIDDGMIDFDEIINSEIESIHSDYIVCEQCQDTETLIEKEF